MVVTLTVFGCGDPEKHDGGADRKDSAAQQERRRDEDEGNSRPQFVSDRLRVYTTYEAQRQHRDFNGIFDIGPRQARVVREYWKRRYNDLTRPGQYGEFFMEFFDYMAYLAQAYPMETGQKMDTLGSLESSFLMFCAALDIEDDFEEFKRKVEKAHANR